MEDNNRCNLESGCEDVNMVILAKELTPCS
jgi:hypothetical protein